MLRRCNYYANLGFAHSASGIVETIVSFGHHSTRDFLRDDYEQHWSPKLGVAEWALEFSGEEVDDETGSRLMQRLHRDRMRDRKYYVRPDDYHDIPELLGPVRKQDASTSPSSPFVAGSTKSTRRR